ncbi:MAG: hypothetical protein Q8936_23845, partial [Bacillota bacterium]|nr:hypothetical protein [Bacillota bacterium]
MITIENIQTSVIDALKTQNLTIYGSEAKADYIKPCFFVQVVSVLSEPVTRNFTENSVTVQILFCSKDGTDIENIRMQDTLNSIFSKELNIGDRKLLPRNFISGTDSDNSLSYNFDLNYLNEIL